MSFLVSFLHQVTGYNDYFTCTALRMYRSALRTGATLACLVVLDGTLLIECAAVAVYDCVCMCGCVRPCVHMCMCVCACVCVCRLYVHVCEMPGSKPSGEPFDWTRHSS